MTLNQLVCRAASVYPDAYVLQYWDMENECFKESPDGGDTLAEFIVRELLDTFDAEASEIEQLKTARAVMQRAADDLNKIVRALDSLASDEAVSEDVP